MILYTCCLVADPCPFRLSFFFFKGWVDYIFLKIKKLLLASRGTVLDGTE